MRISSYSQRLSAEKASTALAALKILSNKNRFRIMKILLGSRRDLCVHELSETLGMTQSATSHQLAYLEARGVVVGVRTGQTKCYVPTGSALTKKVAGIIRVVT